MEIARLPTVDEALYLHALLIERYGGNPGVRDLGLLESALGRARSGYYDSLSEQAAALLQSLALNHCFIDGNKRMAFALTAIFLELNGFELSPSDKDAARFIENDVISGRASIAKISGWIEKHLSPSLTKSPGERRRGRR